MRIKSESTPLPSAANTTVRFTLRLLLPPGQCYNSSPPSLIDSLSDLSSSLYSHGASLSPWESDTEARERTPRPHFYSHDEHCPKVTVSCASLMEELNETR